MIKLDKIIEEVKRATQTEVYPRCYNELLYDLIGIKNDIKKLKGDFKNEK